MRNQMKADFYKLIHSKLLYIILGVMILLFLMYGNMAKGSGSFFMGFVTKHIDNIPVAEGFLGFVFEDKANPMDWEIIYSANVYTSFIWVILMALTVQCYLKEFQNGTIKLSIAYGCNKFILFLSHLFVVLITFAILYYGFNIATLFRCSSIFGVPITGEIMKGMLTLTTLNFLIFIVFTIGVMCFSTLIKNVVVVSSVSIVFMFSMVFLLLATYDRPTALILQIYNHLNPMYYLWRASSFWAEPGVVIKILLFFVFGSTILSGISFYLLKKQEVK